MRKSRLFRIFGVFSSLLLFPVAPASPDVECVHTKNNNKYDTEKQVQEDEECSLVLYGESHKSLMLTETPESITVLGSTCHLTILAVGGGGEGHYSGGGSGYLNYKTVALDQEVNTITAVVGIAKQKSVVTINGHITVEAGRGGDNHYNNNDGHYYGGDGYSGGGSDNRHGHTCNICYGGSKGGNGGGG